MRPGKGEISFCHVDCRSALRGRFCVNAQGEICGRQRFHRIIGLEGEFAGNATGTLIGLIIKEEGIPSGGTPFRASRSTPAPPMRSSTALASPSAVLSLWAPPPTLVRGCTSPPEGIPPSFCHVESQSALRGRFCVNAAGKVAVSPEILATLTGRVPPEADSVSTWQGEICG